MSLKKDSLAVRVLLCAALLAGCATIASAANWSVRSSSSGTVAADSNWNLAPSPTGSTYSANAAWSVDVKATSRTTQFNLAANLGYPYVAGSGAATAGAGLRYGFATNFEKKMRRDTLKVSASLVPENTRTLELVDSGQVTVDAVRWSYGLQASLDHQVDPLNSISLSGSSRRISYSGNAGALTGYTNLSASEGWHHRLSRTSSFNANLDWTRTTPDVLTTPPSDTYSATAGFSADLTRRLSVSAAAGGRTTLNHATGISTGWVGNFGLTYKKKSASYSLFAFQSAAPDALGLVQNTISAGLSATYKAKRATYGWSLSATTGPSSLGSIQNSTGLSVSVSRPINDLSKAGLALSVNDYRGGTDPDRQLLVVSPTYSFQGTKNLQGNLSYTFTQRFGGSGDARSHAVLFGLSHSFGALH